MIETHKLEHAIEISRRSVTVNRLGEDVEAWLPIAGIRAERVNTTSRDFLRGGGEGEEAFAVWRVRYRDDITLEDRVVHKGREFDIVEMIEIGRRNGLELRTRLRQ